MLQKHNSGKKFYLLGENIIWDTECTCFHPRIFVKDNLKCFRVSLEYDSAVFSTKFYSRLTADEKKLNILSVLVK